MDRNEDLNNIIAYILPSEQLDFFFEAHVEHM